MNGIGEGYVIRRAPTPPRRLSRGARVCQTTAGARAARAKMRA